MSSLIRGDKVDITGKEVVIFYGLGFSNPVLASKLNRYMFSINTKLIGKLLSAAFYKQSMPKWIKKPKDGKEDDIDRYCRENGIRRSSVLEQLIRDDPRGFLQEIRADTKDYEKMGIALTKPEKNQWF